MFRALSIVPLGAALALGACAYPPPPTAPTVMALPAQGQNFAQFQQQDASCRQYASAMIGGASPSAAAANAGVGSAAVGTLLGAAAGAAIGAAAGNPAAGAAIGAGSGLVLGAGAGAANAAAVGGGLQAQYNTAYTQCMYANGDKVVATPGAPAGGYPAYAGYPAYGAYPYPYPYAYPFVAAPVVGFGVGFGGGWGGGRGWGGRGWHGDWR